MAYLAVPKFFQGLMLVTVTSTVKSDWDYLVGIPGLSAVGSAAPQANGRRLQDQLTMRWKCIGISVTRRISGHRPRPGATPCRKVNRGGDRRRDRNHEGGR